MSFRLPSDLGHRFEEIFTAYEFAVEDDARDSDELSRAIHLSHVLAFLAWAAREPDQRALGDVLADAESRDRAVGFYKRSLFARAQKPGQINVVLLSLARFYTWWGLGEHAVAYLSLTPPHTLTSPPAPDQSPDQSPQPSQQQRRGSGDESAPESASS